MVCGGWLPLLNPSYPGMRMQCWDIEMAVFPFFEPEISLFSLQKFWNFPFFSHDFFLKFNPVLYTVFNFLLQKIYYLYQLYSSTLKDTKWLIIEPHKSQFIIKKKSFRVNFNFLLDFFLHQSNFLYLIKFFTISLSLPSFHWGLRYPMIWKISHHSYFNTEFALYSSMLKFDTNVWLMEPQPH